MKSEKNMMLSFLCFRIITFFSNYHVFIENGTEIEMKCWVKSLHLSKLGFILVLALIVYYTEKTFFSPSGIDLAIGPCKDKEIKPWSLATLD